MQNTTPNPAWEQFWSSSRHAGNINASGAQDSALTDFWTALFTRHISHLDGARILDVGCGSGALTNFALEVSKQHLVHPKITCLDASAAAIMHIKQNYPKVAAVEADAADMPLPNSLFDMVVSQFGVDYGGPDAATEAVRVLRHGGNAVFIMHMQEGIIDRECRDSSDAITTVLGSGLFPAIIKLFEENMALRKGRGSRVGFELADRALNPTVKAVEQVIKQQGKGVAGGTIFKIYADTAHMYRKMNAFDPDEVIAWARKAELELQAFDQRMVSMQEAAFDEVAIEQLVQRLTASGMEMAPIEQMSMGDPTQPAAWIIQGVRNNSAP